MKRILLHYVLPIVLPFIVYGIWLALARRKAQSASTAGAAAPTWRDAPWMWLLIAGLGLMIAGLVALALTGGTTFDVSARVGAG